MRKRVAMLLLLSLLATLVVCAGCGKKEAQEETKDDLSTAPITASSEPAPSEEELGAPIYPGSVFVSGSGEVEVYTYRSNSWVTVTAPRFATKDAYEDVVAFYTEKLGKPTSTSSTFDEVQMEARWRPIGEEELEIYTSEVVVSREDTGVHIHIVSQFDDI